MATKITIAVLFPDDKGMILVAEDVVDGSLRHLPEVGNPSFLMHLSCRGRQMAQPALASGDTIDTPSLWIWR